ncbi:hypothetical protein BDY21DRAFT_365001 [Lineolata rhizophorae]|uniref:Amidohydrolase-related domain-containing protein n=1 Tax=Lineolata rhizophorae TaxID=578093 RepID=A0A6A6NWU8_9PEZI|nr:hypothetical protein BDY21DRAFT_365001 [Lineolata rhizophorae]
MAKGTIAVEEATIDPGSVASLGRWIKLLEPGADHEAALTAHRKRLQDICEDRLKQMDEEGVEYMLLSITSPGPQGEQDQATAEKMAKDSNDWLAGQVAKKPDRFGALAALSMHSPEQASAELQRAVKTLGMFGALVNDYQTTGLEGTGKEYYDTEKYDPFWKVVEELDVPVYFHPRYPQELGPADPWGARRHLIGAAVSFHIDLSYHIYAMCSSGTFDRFPNVKIVVGHLGENIPFNLWRACHWYNKPSKKATRPSKHDYKHYFKTNVYITTSGNFNTRGLKFCIEELGVDRCLYSIDTPYDAIIDGQTWWRSVDIPEDQKRDVGRRNAIRLFKLPLEL